MKKTVSLILTVFILISCFTLCANAQGKTDALLEKVADAKEMQVTLKAGNTMLGSSTETYYIKGNDAALDWTNGFITIRVLLKDGKAYAYFPSVPFLYVKLSNTGLLKLDIPALLKTAMGATGAITVFESEGEETIDGTTYFVETYNDRAQAKLKFCYIGDELKLLKVTNRTGTALESVNYTYFENYSFSVDSSVMKTPVGLDLTPILSALITALLASKLPI